MYWFYANLFHNTFYLHILQFNYILYSLLFYISALVEKSILYKYLFHPRFVVPIPLTLYHPARIRVGISLISTSFSRRVILWKMRVILWK